jgi:aryl sulfotransferase
MSARPIVWLASYPKSGNTWLRALLTNYLHPANEPARIDALEGGITANARVWFDEYCGVEASALSDALIERLRPDVYRCLAREARGTLFVKVHDAWTRTDRDEPLFPPDMTAGVVCLVRNPLDLVASLATHWGISIDESVAAICDPTMVLARSERSLHEQLPQRIGTWSDHVHSWLDSSGLAVHLVRYEDLIQRPDEVFADVVRFCGLETRSADVARAVAFSGFAELQHQEQRGGFRERPSTASGPFFRHGEVGRWRQELDDAHVQRVVTVHSELMRLLGYLGSTA